MRDNLSYVVDIVIDDGAAWRVVIDIAVVVDHPLASRVRFISL